MKIDQWTNFVSSIRGDSAGEAVLRSGDRNRIMQLATSKGFDFTQEDLADLLAGQLTEDELDKVTGAVVEFHIFRH